MSTQDSRRQSFAALNYSDEVNRAAADGSGAASPHIMPPHATLPHALPAGSAATSPSAMNVRQQGSPSMAVELPSEDYARLSSDKGHNHNGKKGKRMFSKDHKKHKNGAARHEHGSGNPSPSHKHLHGTAVVSVPAIQQPSAQAEFNPFGIRTCWRDDIDTVDPSYTRGTENHLLLPVIDGGKEMAGIFSYEAEMSQNRPKKKHKHDSRHNHGAKHKHRHREPHETLHSPDAEPESTRCDANEFERDHRVQTGYSQKLAAVDKPAKRHKHHHKESKGEVQLTTADAILKQSEALFPDAADGSALRKEEIELENQMLNRRASMISRDFFLSRNDEAIDDVLQRQTAHIDQLAKISPDFSHLVFSRKYYMRSSRDLSGMSPHDSRSLSSPSDRHATPDSPHRQSPGTGSLSEYRVPSPDAGERDVLPNAFSHGPISSIVLVGASTTLGPLNSVALAEPRLGETGRGVADSGRAEIPAKAASKRSKKKHRTGGADPHKATSAADTVGPMSRGKCFGAEQNLDSYLLPPAVQTAVPVLRRTQSDDTFSFVPDCSDRKVNEQSDVFHTLPHSQLDSHGGKVVPTSSYLSVVPAACKVSDSTHKVAHRTDLSGVEQAIPSKSTAPVLPHNTENALHDEAAVSHTRVDVFDNVERDSEQGSSRTAKETDTRQQARDSQSACPPASLSGPVHDPENHAVTTYEAALTEQLRDCAGHLVGHADEKLVVQELSDQSPGYGILEESGKNLPSALSTSQKSANGAIDTLETEVKLMMGLPTSEAGLKAHVSMEDFEAISEGQERVPVDQEAPCPKELQVRREAEMVDVHFRVPLERASSQHDAGRQEATEATHEAPASLPPDKESKAPFRSPGSTNVVPSVVPEDAAEAKAATPPESVKRASLTIRTVPVLEKQHCAREDAGNKDAKASRSPSLAWRKKKGRSFLRRSLDQSQDRTASPSPPSTSMSPAAAAMLHGKCRGSLDTATLYAVKPRGSTSKPHLWHELSAVMSRPVFVGISTPEMAGVVVLMDEDEIDAQLNHVLPAGSQVHLRELDISAGKPRVNRK